LEKINNRHMLRHHKHISDAFEQFIDLPSSQESIDYTFTKSIFPSFWSVPIWHGVDHIFRHSSPICGD
jgi:hypothetical protein